MSDLTLRYTIKLLSDIGVKAQADAKALVEAQRLMGKSTQTVSGEIVKMDASAEKASTKLGKLDQVMANVGKSNAMQRQTKIMEDLGKRIDENTTKLSRFKSALATGLEKLPQYMASAGAALYAADRLTRKPMDYSATLARMSNTAFSGRDVAGRLSGKRLLEEAVKTSVRSGGGTLDDGASALDSMVASGALSVDESVKLLPSVMKGSSASGADAKGIAMIAVRAMQTAKIPLEQVPEAINIAMKGGAAGGFELKDMDKWLPSALAAGSQTGMTGLEGFRRIVASMQASVTTAGTKDAAGNNVVNLLGKMSSQDTAKDFQKLGIDLPAEFAKGRKNGVSSIDVMVEQVDKIMSKDKEYVALQKKLAASKSRGEKDAVTEDMVSILQGKSLGKVSQDREASMALLAELNNRSYVRDVLMKTRSPISEVDASFGVISQETSFKRQLAGNEMDIAASTGFAKVAPVLNSIFETGTDVARQFPLLTAAAVASTAALGVFAGMLGAFDLVGLLTGRGKGGMPGVPRAPGAPGLSGGAAAAAGRGLFKGGGLRSLGLVGMLASELFTTSDEEMEALQNASRMRTARGVGFADPRRLDKPLAPLPPIGGSDLSNVLGLRQLPLGDGKLDVNVMVTDDRVSATTSVRQPMTLIRLNPGSTNPGGFAPSEVGGR